MAYEYIDVVKVAIETANAHIPRLHKSAIAEIGEIFSAEVTRDSWGNYSGESLNRQGETIAEHIETLVAARPHSIIPPEVVSAGDSTWLEGSLAAQARRWKEIRSVLGDDASTNAALAAEAALYGTTVGSTKPGVKPGAKPAYDPASKISPNNPWSASYATRVGPDAAEKEKARLLRVLGTKACISLAASAGVTVLGAPIKK
jgi:hypothetical protein